MDSEFIALYKVGEETDWLRHFLEDVSSLSKPILAICIQCNSPAIGRAQINVNNVKSRHISHRHNIIRQLLSNGVIAIDYVKSNVNIVPPLTR